MKDEKRTEEFLALLPKLRYLQWDRLTKDPTKVNDLGWFGEEFAIRGIIPDWMLAIASDDIRLLIQNNFTLVFVELRDKKEA
jgi:hypothetical protein